MITDSLKIALLIVNAKITSLAHIGENFLCNLPCLHSFFKWEVGQQEFFGMRIAG